MKSYSETVTWRCSIQKAFLKNLSKFTGKHLCQRILTLQVYKKGTWYICSSCEFLEIFRNTLLTEHLQRLLVMLFHQSNLWLFSLLQEKRITCQQPLAGKCKFKVNSKITILVYWICSKLSIKTLKRCHVTSL